MIACLPDTRIRAACLSAGLKMPLVVQTVFRGTTPSHHQWGGTTSFAIQALPKRAKMDRPCQGSRLSWIVGIRSRTVTAWQIVKKWCTRPRFYTNHWNEHTNYVHSYCESLQVDRAPMNLDDLCDEITANESIHRVMHHWKHTRSPLVYWTRQMANMAAGKK